MANESLQRSGVKRLGGAILGSIAAAVLIGALFAGLWYFLRGRRDQRTPETPQTTSCIDSLAPAMSG